MNSFQAVNKIYQNANQYELNFHKLNHYDLYNFSTALFRLEKVIWQNDLTNELLLSEVILSYRKYRFFVVASLLPFNQYESILNIERLVKLYKRCLLLYPNIAYELESCNIALENLLKSSENPILNYIQENIITSSSIGVLLKATNDFEGTKRLIKSIFPKSNFKLIGPQVLKTNTFFEQLIVIGPSRWFPAYIYNSPHAHKIHTITFKWLERSFHEEPYLEGENITSTIFSGRNVNYFDPLFQKDEKELVIFDTNIEKTVDFSHIEQKLKNSKEKDVNEKEEIVTARLVMLSGYKGIFFEQVSLKNIFSIYFESDGLTVGKTSINEIEPNSYILIRTGTKQDLIRTKADEIIGISAPTFRNFHKRWKTRLKKFVNRYGMLSVHLDLIRHGVKNPTEQNIRNWMSEDNIMPASESDFRSILKFVKLEEMASKHIKVAKLLRRAHIEAGSFIRAKLVEEIKNTDLTSFELRDKHVFNLSGEKGVSFTAYRVEYISEQLYKLSPSELKEVFSLR